MGANEQPVLLRRHRVTVDDYHRMAEVGILAPDARTELIDGEVIDMAPMKSAHAEAVNHLAERLHEAAAGHVRGQCRVHCQTPLRLSDHGEPEPDLMLVRRRDYSGAHPTPADVLLLIEVADTSLAYDRQVKVPLYAGFGVPEVWIVDLVNREVLFHRGPDAAARTYKNITASEAPGSVRVASLPEVSVDLSGLFTPA